MLDDNLVITILDFESLFCEPFYSGLKAFPYMSIK